MWKSLGEVMDRQEHRIRMALKGIQIRGRVRKAVAGILAFIVGISILIVTIIPLLIYLNRVSGEMIRAFNSLSEYQRHRSLESIDILVEGNRVAIKNTGSVAEAFILAVIDNGYGCNNRASILKINIALDPGDKIYSINTSSSSYTLDKICYVMTSRGNVFPVREKYLAVLVSLAPPAIITNESTRFADDMKSWSISVYYSIGSDICNVAGLPWIGVISPIYNKKLLTINSSATEIVKYELGGQNRTGCALYRFKDLLSLDRPGYAVLTIMRVVIIGTNLSNIRLDANAYISIIRDNVYISTASAYLTWNPAPDPRRDTDYIVWDIVGLIPISNIQPGTYSLEIKLILTQIIGKGAYYVGIEYLVIQGMRLIV
jgi:hypothetical protein